MAIIINGVAYAGNDLTIIDNKVFIDGVAKDQSVNGVVKVVIEGQLANVRSDASIQCGDVGGDVSAGSSVSAGDVQGDVSAGSSVTCRNVGGDVSAGSSVAAGDVVGDISAGGRVVVTSRG